ncbi:MAG: MerR family DNA-binding transcriptional regulator [Anaerolineae bacterium]|nr:MerR family DNA-binding transcriptional regulator [Anaerolineae bacterium]
MAPRYLRTSDIARATGVHPNTVRLYEEWGYLSPVPRSRSGYRLFTEIHQDQMRLARTILNWPYPGGKALVLDILHKSAVGDLGGALELAYTYLARVRAEHAHADAAIEFLEQWAGGQAVETQQTAPLLIGEAAKRMGVSVDKLRNWERNGLLSVPRDPGNGYRLYGIVEIGRARVIRMLLQTGYSLMSILRALQEFDRGQTRDLREILDTPRSDEDIYTVADHWLSTLAMLEQRVLDSISQIKIMIDKHYE